MLVIKRVVLSLFLLTSLIVNISWVNALTSRFYTDSQYAGQWSVWNLNFFQWRWNLDNSRSTAWMKWNFINEIWVKTKIFTSWQAPSFVDWWVDINWDGRENILYWFWWKLYLWDINSWLVLWETKVLDVKSLLWVEDILWNGVKSIVVLLWEDRYLWIIDWQTWELTWTSHFASGPMKNIMPWWAWFNWRKADINWDWINEYHFKQRYKKYHSFRLTASWSTVVWETLWSSDWYGEYNEWSDWYQPSWWAMWNISGQQIVWTKWSNTFAFYSNNVDNTQTWSTRFQMPAFGKFIVWGNSWAWWSDMNWYFYDLNLDWNDEFISRINEETNNNKLSRVIVWWLNWSGSMVQYTSISYPREVDGEGKVINKWNYHMPLALRNSSDPSNSYVLTYGYDPLSTSNKWMMLKYDWLTSSWWTKNSWENTTFNESIVYDTIPEWWFSPTWIFNNWTKDYIVTNQSGKYYFYEFTWTWTFQTPSTIEVTWWFYWNTLFDWMDSRREKNKSWWQFLATYDTDWNGLNEFVVTDGWFFKFYEITDTGVSLRYSFWSYSSIPWVRKWGMTSDLKDMYWITYDSSKNTINYYRTNSSEWEFNFTKKTSDTLYSGWQIRDMSISKLWQWTEAYNKLMISGLWMFDARSATPASPPVKIWNDYYNKTADVDWDWVNEVWVWWSAHTFNSPWNTSKKYEQFWDVWDINGDGVIDTAWAYCWSTPTLPSNLFLTVRDWRTWTPIVPDIDWWNGNGYCSAWGRDNFVWFDYDWDGLDELAVWTYARSTRLVKFNPDLGTITQWNWLWNSWHWTTLQAFDVDGDWVQEIIRWHDKSAIFSWSWITLTNLFNVEPSVKDTFNNSLWIPSLYRDATHTYFAYRWIDGQVALASYDIVNKQVNYLFNSYYVSWKKYADSTAVLDDSLIPLFTADVLVWDFIWNNTVSVLVWGWDGWVYLLDTSWNVIRYFNVWSAIRRIIHGDVSNSGYLSVFVSAEDWYIYQLTNSNLSSPSWVKDGPNYWYDIETQTSNKKVSVNYSQVSKATWYFVQLYNKTEKSVVFDWVDAWNKSRACVVSMEIDDPNCIKATKSFSLNGKSIYEWRVQSYNSNVTSPTSTSNWFSVLNLTMDKKVAKKEDLNFMDEITVSPNTLLTYKILVENDSLNTVWGAWYMNYDMIPPQPVSNCTGVSDCRTKNLTISDYMPTTFTYMPNSTIWIVKKINYDWSEDILAWGSQVSDWYFKNQSDTNLVTSPWATLIWQFPTNIAIPPGWFLELQFDAIAKQ